ncbi:MAG: adenine deaminase C-terminal domain-containing protein, partial [Candidatus Jordarchaeaceae archaeon]
RILVTACAPRIPEPLIQQLAEGGRLGAPVGEHSLMQTWVVAVKRGECVARLTLNFAGLMSTAPIEEVIQGAEKLKKAVKAMGCKLEAPFMTLSFLSLPVIPELKITEKGLIDVINQEITSVLV